MENNNKGREIADYDLFLNMVGGHALIIKIGKGRIIKSANKNEIQFYESDLHKVWYSTVDGIFPKYYGTIKRQPEQKYNQYDMESNNKDYKSLSDGEINSNEFQTVLAYFEHLDFFFYSFLHKIRKSDISNDFFNKLNLEKDEEFQDKLEKFLQTKKFSQIFDGDDTIPDKIINYVYTYDKNLEDKLSLMDESKLKWIIFWYVKWREEFMKNDFVILEDLTDNMEYPAIIDFKLGFHQKKRKKDFSIKQLPRSSKDLGFRIMGMQVNNNF